MSKKNGKSEIGKFEFASGLENDKEEITNLNTYEQNIDVPMDNTEKYHFISEIDSTNEEVDESASEENMEEFHLSSQAEEQEALKEEEKNEPVVEEKVIPQPVSSETRSIKKVHFSYEFRVTILVIGILFLFAFACFIIVKSLSSNSLVDVTYEDKSTVDYNVCNLADDPYQVVCEQKADEYVSQETDKIHVTYQYDAKFSRDISYDYAYHVVVLNRIYDGSQNNKLLYEKEYLVVEPTTVEVQNQFVSFDADIALDFQKYNDEVSNYIQKYSENAVGRLDAILYIDEESNTRGVAKLSIPLGLETFNVEIEEVDETAQQLSVVKDSWSNHNTLYVLIGSVLILLSLLLLCRLTRLVIAASAKKSVYESTLMKILNEYDRYIVIARDGYESNIVKNTVKVDSFKELLDARDILNKPIIYSRINNVKSEFIVEDDSQLYKYVLKEGDLMAQQESNR